VDCHPNFDPINGRKVLGGQRALASERTVNGGRRGRERNFEAISTKTKDIAPSLNKFGHQELIMTFQDYFHFPREPLDALRRPLDVCH